MNSSCSPESPTEEPSTSPSSSGMSPSGCIHSAIPAHDGGCMVMVFMAFLGCQPPVLGYLLPLATYSFVPSSSCLSVAISLSKKVGVLPSPLPGSAAAAAEQSNSEDGQRITFALAPQGWDKKSGTAAARWGGGERVGEL